MTAMFRLKPRSFLFIIRWLKPTAMNFFIYIEEIKLLSEFNKIDSLQIKFIAVPFKGRIKDKISKALAKIDKLQISNSLPSLSRDG